VNLTKQSWPLGWTPSADAVNGSPDGLLRMDNLQQEETGALTLVRGIKKLNATPFSDYVYRIFSKTINGQETIWAALSITGRQIIRTNNDFSSQVTVLDNGGDVPCFGDCLGEVLCISGDQKKKDNGSLIKNLGIATPDKALEVASVNQDMLTIPSGGAFQPIEGHDFAGNLIFVDSQTLRGVMEADLTGGDPNGGLDTVNFGGQDSKNQAQDTFTLVFQTHDTNNVLKFRVEFFMDDTDNYYFKEWPMNGGDFNLGPSAQTKLTLQRSEFTRAGADTTLDWTKIKKLRVSCTCTADQYFLVDEVSVWGGAKGSLNSTYEYLAINVDDNGIYQAKSGPSPLSKAVNVLNGYVTLTPPSNPDGNDTWYFRRSVPDPTSTDIPKLDDFYYVCNQKDDGGVDKTSDDDALRINRKANRFLKSLADTDFGYHIISMDGLYHERMLYLTAGGILLSDRLNPDAIDIRFILKASGDQTEKNLFIRRLTNNSILLGTTKDLYLITGTLLDQPDGTLDATIAPIGEAYPPLSADFGFVDGNLFYVGADGVRSTSGSNSIHISAQLNLLFQGLNRHGVPPVAITTDDNAIYSIAVGHTRLYTALPMQDGTRRLFVYDLAKQTWRMQFTDPLCVYVTQTDRVLLGYSGGDGNYVRQLDIGNDIDGTCQGLPFTFQTVYDCNGQPRNRKDTFTLKWIGDTGGKTATISIAKDGHPFQVLGTLNTNGLSTIYFRLDSFTLGFRYAIKIESTDVNTYKQYELTIEYDARPEQLNYLRIPSTNLNTVSRKRFISYAFVIDTLGNTVNFTPYVDGAAISTGTPNTITLNGKLTYIHFFNSNVEGVDISGILQSQDEEAPFEFYQINLEESVSEKLPAAAKYLVIPANNYGSPNRKRHTSYKFQAHTRSKSVRFTPRVDGVNYAPLDFSTSEKRIVEYFFDTSIDVKGIDIGGVLQTLEDTAFEFYGVITPQHIEMLPDRLESYYIPFDNLGTASRKRVRTLPIVIDTYGSDVVFTPIVDGVEVGPPTTLNSSRKQTLYHYFITDVFGIDFGGKLIGTTPFEFYSFGNPEEVEVLPVPKKFDQLQPMRWDKIGKLFAFRTRLIMAGATTKMPFTIYGDDSPTVPVNSNVLYSGEFDVIPNTDNVYHINMPKNVNSTIMRIVLGPTADPFHRYDLIAKVAQSGMESDSKWVTVR